MNKFIIVCVILGSVLFVAVIAAIIKCLTVVLYVEYENEKNAIQRENLELVEA